MRKRMGAPPGCKRRPKTESEVEDWTARVHEKAIQAILKRSGTDLSAQSEGDAADVTMHESLLAAISILPGSSAAPLAEPAAQ